MEIIKLKNETTEKKFKTLQDGLNNRRVEMSEDRIKNLRMDNRIHPICTTEM